MVDVSEYTGKNWLNKYLKINFVTYFVFHSFFWKIRVWISVFTYFCCKTTKDKLENNNVFFIKLGSNYKLNPTFLFLKLKLNL